MVTRGSVFGGGVVGAAGARGYPLPPPSVRVKNEWSIPLLHNFLFIGYWGVFS